MQVAQGNLEITYRASGYYDRRVAELRERLRRTPDDREARWELARAYAALGHSTTRRSPSSRRCSPGIPTTSPRCSSSAWPRRRAAGVEAAEEWFRRAAEQDPDSPVALFYYGEALYNRGLNEAGARGARARPSHRNPDYADAHYLLAFVLGDMGLHDDARAATKRAIALNPTLGRAQANLSHRRDRRTAGAEAARPAGRDAAGSSSRAARWPTSTSGSPSARRATTPRRCASTGSRSMHGEDRRLTLQAMAEVHLLRRDLTGALELYDALVGGTRRLAEGLERARGLPAPGRAAGRGAADSYERAIAARPRLRAGLEQPRRAAGRTTRAPARREAAFRAALQVRRRPRRAAAQPRAAAHAAAPLPAGARGLSRRCCADHADNAAAWNGIGLVLMELQALRRRAERLRPRGGRRPGLRRGALQPELHAEPAGRLRRRAAGDQARARARAVLHPAEVRADDRPAVRGSH